MEIRRLTLADKAEIESIAALAAKIWRERYDPIVGREQNDYMIKKFQSAKAITEQLENGYRYYFLFNEAPVGFFAFYPRNDAMYLSKLYLVKEERGKGYSKKMIEFVKERASEEGLSAIELNVNKYNESVLVYEKLGFIRIRSEKIDIGKGFYMDDYVYRLEF